MPDYNTIQAYLSVVEDHIRWKRARSVVSRELRQHLEDQRDAFAADGFADAERMAVEEMGSPAETGAELDHIHRPKPQWGLLGLTVILALAGAFLRVYLTKDWSYSAVRLDRVLLSLALGTAALLGGYFLDCSRLLCRPKTVCIAALAAGLVCLLLCSVQQYPSRTGYRIAYYWGYLLQLYPVAYAVWLYHWRGKGWRGFWIAVAGEIPMILLCLSSTGSLSGTGTGLFNALTLLAGGCVLLFSAVKEDWFRISRPLAASVLA